MRSSRAAPVSAEMKPRASCGTNKVMAQVRRAADSATDPFNQRGRPMRPWVASTIRSARNAIARLAIACAGSPPWDGIFLILMPSVAATALRLAPASIRPKRSSVWRTSGNSVQLTSSMSRASACRISSRARAAVAILSAWWKAGSSPTVKSVA